MTEGITANGLVGNRSLQGSPSPHLMPAAVQAKRWHVAGDEAVMSEREARTTLTGLKRHADMLCIKTFLCLHAAVRRYKLTVATLPGMNP